MRVFIEQPGEKNKKNIFDKGTGLYVKTIDFHLTYPYAYGYILDTRASDGDNLDCYVLTNAKQKTGSIVECDPVGMVEYFEDGLPDHKILVSLKGESRIVDDEVKMKLLDFNARYYQKQPNRKTEVGNFLGKDDAVKEIAKNRNSMLSDS